MGWSRRLGDGGAAVTAEVDVFAAEPVFDTVDDFLAFLTDLLGLGAAAPVTLFFLRRRTINRRIPARSIKIRSSTIAGLFMNICSIEISIRAYFD